MLNYLTFKEVAHGYWRLMLGLVKEGKLKQIIHKSYAFENLAEAFTDISGGQNIGKLVRKLGS
jgi:NADPH-dependent curcumin reductase CurA